LNEHNCAIVFINGPMGVGKTTFSRDLSKLFNAYNVSSSSFSLINIFYGDRTIIHADFYRQNCRYEILEYEVLPLLKSPYLALLEWCAPQLIDRSAKHFTLDISFTKNGSRKYLFNTFTNSKSILAKKFFSE